MRGYQSHESFWADIQMYQKLIGMALLCGLIFQTIFMFFVYKRTIELTKNIYIKGTNSLMPETVFGHYFLGLDFWNSGIEVEPELQKYIKNLPNLPLKEYRRFADWLSSNAYKNLLDYLQCMFKISFISYTTSVAYFLIFIKTSRGMEDDEFVRGSELLPLEDLNEELEKEARKILDESIRIGNTPLPFEMESKHVLALGASGSGKGVFMNQVMAQVNARKRKSRHEDRCVFYDLKGEYVAKQYNSKRDLIFYPFDERTVKWRLFNEIEDYPDFEVVSKSLYLPPNDDSTYWYNCASDVFRAGLLYLNNQNQRTNLDVLQFFSKPLEEMKKCLKTLPLKEHAALKHIDKDDSQASADIISVLTSRIGFFKYLVDSDGDFSFRKFIRDREKPSAEIRPNLYILNRDQYRLIFQPLMSFALDTMIHETLSIPDKLERRIYFVVDELGSLFKMESVLNLLTVGRSKGACLFCANQDLGRIKDIYGESNVETFFNNFNTNFIFRINDPKTANFLSQAIGEQQIIRKTKSRQMSPSDIGDRKSFSEQDKTEKIILGTELQNFKDLEAIIKIANHGVSKIEVPKIFYKERHPDFIMKKFKVDDSLPIQEETCATIAASSEPQSFVEEQAAKPPKKKIPSYIVETT